MTQNHTVTLEAAGKHLTLSFPSEEDHIARVIRRTGTFYEAELLSDLRSRLFFPACAVDVGAHVGNHSVYFAHVLGIRTIAFEPNPVNCVHLEANVRDNGLEGLCRVRNAAVGAANGHVRTVSSTEGNSGMATVETDPAGAVVMVTLDDEILEEAAIDVIKIDVEGWELEVLRGAERSLRRHRPLLYIEIMEPKFAEVETHLRERGYLCWKRFNFTPTFLFMPVERFTAG
ncbi:MAG: group 1 glycosyltransferase [Devosia sp.]|uniref:FkbM family methyltransferase n=1 Tax=Devosia sp. TaxID=1871048 RepID=UPI00260FBCDF|nr:FkbM family methyltransferase [Devosia sp.]MDB5538997.1 group 1 glycosyltransferase [Devosia sp.]